MFRLLVFLFNASTSIDAEVDTTAGKCWISNGVLVCD